MGARDATSTATSRASSRCKVRQREWLIRIISENAPELEQDDKKGTSRARNRTGKHPSYTS